MSAHKPTEEGTGRSSKYPSISPSTLAKNLVSSIASVLRLSLSPSNSFTMMGALVRLLSRTLSPRSHTATPEA